MSQNILVIGSANVDLLVKTSRIPAPGETIIGGEYATALGGKGANQAVAAARLGGHVTMVGRVGGDSYGQEILTGLRSDDIVTEYLQVDHQTHTGVAFIIVDEEGQNSIVVSSGANMRVDLTDLERALPAINSADVLVIQLEIPVKVVEHVAALVNAKGGQIVFNPAPANPQCRSILHHVNYLILNESEAEILTGVNIKELSNMKSASEILHRMGAQVVILTLGKEGAFISSKEIETHVPAYPVVPVDTTAAGDAFVGAFAVAISSGKSLIDAVQFACAAGALATTKIGAQPSLPDLAAVERLLDIS
jgi:ribokinase